jgi:hypothetical protein
MPTKSGKPSTKDKVIAKYGQSTVMGKCKDIRESWVWFIAKDQKSLDAAITKATNSDYDFLSPGILGWSQSSSDCAWLEALKFGDKVLAGDYS